MSNFRRLHIDNFSSDFTTTIGRCIQNAVVTDYVDDGLLEYHTSEEYLRNCLTAGINHDIAESRYLGKFQQDLNRRLIRFLIPLYPKSSIVPSGNFLYPPGGYMGWHTNSDFPCKRVYITFAEQINKSGFKYLDKTNKVVDDVDEQHITIREFDISSSEHLWHCVYSNTNRYSFGFRVESF